MDIRNSLAAHYQEIANAHMHDLLLADPSRASRYAAEFGGLYINYSRHRVTDRTLNLLFDLARQANLEKRVSDLFAGQLVNHTEQRPALHTALRSSDPHPLTVDGINIRTQIRDELAHMEKFISDLHDGKVQGYSGKPVNKLVNLGIGGSYLGPRFICDALHTFKTGNLEICFVASIDYREIDEILQVSDPETTLFIVSSKSFSTVETLANAETARRWLTDNGCKDPDRHFIAITANETAAENFGVARENIFRLWDWVGGRYSVWSVTGLPAAACIGMENFRSFLAGASTMDEHFHNTPFEQNIPVILGLLDVWYINYFNTETLAVIPYDQSLKLLPDYLGQLIMESNGKTTGHDSKPVTWHTAPVVWGGTGTNVQHTFMQLLHQGTHLAPVDFLVGTDSADDYGLHHKLLVSNCLAQGEALMNGNLNESDNMEPCKIIRGNNPSTTIIYKSLTPETLGMLLALYEHRTFVQAAIWNINPFDQWGVELGKRNSEKIMSLLENDGQEQALDAITTELLKQLHKSDIKK